MKKSKYKKKIKKLEYKIYVLEKKLKHYRKEDNVRFQAMKYNT